MAAGAAVTSGAGCVAMGTLAAEGFEIHAPHFHWNHSGPLDQLDMKRLKVILDSIQAKHSSVTHCVLTLLGARQCSAMGALPTSGLKTFI